MPVKDDSPVGKGSLLGRREFIRRAGVVTAAFHAPGVSALQAQDLSRRIALIIGEYHRQGIHRTGSNTDTKSARWLAGAVKRLGLNPLLEPFVVSRVDPVSSYLQIGGRRIEGLPVFDGGFTDAAGARGRIG